ncbi:MAG: hypothetical protein WBG46_07245 [Nonlabens sp.]
MPDLLKMLRLFLIIVIFSHYAMGQQMSWSEWKKESESNIRLLPQYGEIEKTAGQIEADQKFIEQMLEQYPTRTEASDRMIEIGFKYLYQDIKTAMYRFNQAYLLDKENSDIY